MLGNAPAVRPDGLGHLGAQLDGRWLRARLVENPVEEPARVVAQAQAEVVSGRAALQCLLRDVQVLPDAVLALGEGLRVAEREVDGVAAVVHARGADNGGRGRGQGDGVRVVHVDGRRYGGCVQRGRRAIADYGEVSRIGSGDGMECVCAERGMERIFFLAG